jgi:hypothetical protein
MWRTRWRVIKRIRRSLAYSEWHNLQKVPFHDGFLEQSDDNSYWSDTGDSIVGNSTRVSLICDNNTLNTLNTLTTAVRGLFGRVQKEV